MTPPASPAFIAQLEVMAAQVHVALVAAGAPEKVLKSGDQFIADLKEWKGASNGK